MNKDKQIDEMARIIDDNHGFIVSSVETAEKLYTAGYRKADDVAEEIIHKLENGIDGLVKVYIEERAKEFAIDTPLAEYLSGKVDACLSIKFWLAELKKKYESEGEG